MTDRLVWVDIALDVFAIVLVVIGVSIVWRINVSIRGALAKLQDSTGRVEAARDQIIARNHEIHDRAIAALDGRLKALEEREPPAQ